MAYSADYKNLPEPTTLRKRLESLALLDAILMPTWEYRYFSFDAQWDPDEGEAVASLRDGSGDHFFILFSPEGVFGKVYSQNDQANLPVDLFAVQKMLNEPAFRSDESSFVFWWDRDHKTWFATPDDKPEYSYLGFLENDWKYYLEWATNYYERDINTDVLKRVYEFQALDEITIKALNQSLTLEDIQEDVEEIFGQR